jgi:phospholipid/cholesterol/gamma-HCH transport system substrate-binding protein
LPDGTIVKGVDPPRLDLFLAKAYDLLDTTVTGIRNNRQLISDIAVNTAGLLKGLNETLTDNRPRVDRIVQNVEALSVESNELVRDAKKQYIDNPKIQRTIDNVDTLTADVTRDAAPLLKDAREAMANVNRVSATVGDPAQQEKLKKALSDLAELASRANAMAADAREIVSHMKKGEGTVGALVMDESVYDDVQEMVRDLKHNPWKFLWKQ